MLPCMCVWCVAERGGEGGEHWCSNSWDWELEPSRAFTIALSLHGQAAPCRLARKRPSM